MEKLWEILDKKETRIEACRNNILLFSIYYFQHYQHYQTPLFHKDLYSDLLFENNSGALWMAFRESAKSSLAKIKIIHAICYNYKHFINWTSFDQKKAEGNLFDVVIELQTNQRILADFGQLFFDESIEKKSKKKSIGEFITNNNIKVKAYSTGQSIRGEVYGAYRPDLSILDDIETIKTIPSEAKTRQVIEYVDELLSGLGGSADVLVLANKISNTGSIKYIEDKVKNLDDWIIRDIPVMINGEIVWKDKYVGTNEEAKRINAKIEDKQKRKVSLQAKKELLGETAYNREMMNQPLSDKDREFKWSWLCHFYIPEEIEKRVRNRYITIDVADSKEREDRKSRGVPDYTGITVVDWDVENYWYVVYAKRERVNLPELIEKIFWLWEMYKPIKIGVEKRAFEDQVNPYILQKSEEIGIYPVVEELEHGGTRKEDRIRGALQGRCQAGKIKFIKDAKDNTDDLRMELYDFPKATFDDCSDGLAYIEQIGTRPITMGNSPILTEISQEFYENKKPKNNSVNIIRRI